MTSLKFSYILVIPIWGLTLCDGRPLLLSCRLCKMITTLIASTKRAYKSHGGKCSFNASYTAETFPDEQNLTNPCYRSWQLALACVILKSVGIIFEFLWIEIVPLSLVKDLGICPYSLVHKLQILFWWLAHTSAAEPAHPQSRTPVLTSGHWLQCFTVNSLYLYKLTQTNMILGLFLQVIFLCRKMLAASVDFYSRQLHD